MRSCAAIATASSQRAALIRPRGVGLAIASLVVGVTLALAFAGGIAVLVALAVAVTLAVAHMPAAERSLHAQRARSARHARHFARELRLEGLNIAPDELVALTEIVDLVIAKESTEADVYELEPLLDLYVDVAIARRRCVVAVMKCDRSALFRKLDRFPASGSSRVRGIVERRIKQALACERRARELDDGLANVGDLIRCYGERATLPDVTGVIDLDPLAMPLARYDALTSE
jgi:hypothetical protein